MWIAVRRRPRREPVVVLDELELSTPSPQLPSAGSAAEPRSPALHDARVAIPGHHQVVMRVVAEDATVPVPSALAAYAPHLPPALEGIGAACYIVDRSGRIVWANPAAQAVVGDVEGHLFTSIVAPEEVDI